MKAKEKKGFFSNHTIKRRWIVNHLAILFVVIAVIDIVLCFFIRFYFYSSARQYMSAKLNAVAGELQSISENQDVNFVTTLNTTIEEFSDKDKMELMVIDKSGVITVTSSGFMPQSSETMPDIEALKKGGLPEWQGHIESGEEVIAVSKDISSFAENYSYVRVVSSMTEVNRNIYTIDFVVTVVCAMVFLLLLFTGSYFVKSIVNPILEINKIAGKFATGDFSKKIKIKQKDEIGELGEALNAMANTLENAESMKNEFISSVSHELRTPLTAIKGWAETINFEAEPGTTMQKGIGIIISETDRLSEMVEELLDFSRMQTGHFSLKIGLVDILAELGDAVLMYSEKAKKEKIQLLYKEPEDLPFVNGDRNRLRQVFINIIDNAIKYSNPGGAVKVEAAKRGANIEVIVNDMGCGIKAEDLPKVKIKFYRANLSVRGSGIGLAVANEIVEMHHGTLTITSKENVGTTVIVSLPYVRENKEAK